MLTVSGSLSDRQILQALGLDQASPNITNSVLANVKFIANSRLTRQVEDSLSWGQRRKLKKAEATGGQAAVSAWMSNEMPLVQMYDAIIEEILSDPKYKRQF